MNNRSCSSGDRLMSFAEPDLLTPRAGKVNNKGVALFLTLVVMAVMVMLGSIIHLRNVNEALLVRRQVSEAKAFWFAEAALQRMTWEINVNQCQGLKNLDTGKVCASCKDCGKGKRILGHKLADGEYAAVVDEEYTEIKSRGYYPSLDEIQSSRGLAVELARGSLFGYAAFAEASLSIDRSVSVDSYDSEQGEYGGSNVGAQGHVGSNAVGPGGVQVEDAVSINGNLTVGAQEALDMNENAMVTGNVSLGNNFTLSAVTVPQSLQNSTYLGVYSLSGNESATLEPGDHKYDYIDMGANSRLGVNGDVQIYLTNVAETFRASSNVQIDIPAGSSLKLYTEGRVALSSNVTVNNESKDPSKFIIYSAFTGKEGVSLDTGGGSMQVAVYAPETQIIVVDNSEVFGSLIGEEVELQPQVRLHYDVSLLEETDANAPILIRNWEEN